MENEFYFDERHQADYDNFISYYLYKHDKAQYEIFHRANDCDEKDAIMQAYCEKHESDEYDIARAGMIEVINDGIIKTPAYIDWEHCPFIYYRGDAYEKEMELDGWINSINNPQQRVELLNYLIGSADILYDYDKKKAVAHLKAMLPKHKAAAQERQKELKRQAAEERAKNKQPKEKPEYTLSVDEIIQYVRNAGSHTASAISDMLRYFAFEKDGWKKDVIKKKLLLLDTPVVVQGDLVQGNKNEANFQVPVGQVNQNVEHMNTNKE